MSEQYNSASKLYECEEVFTMPFESRHQSAKVLEPCEESLDLPSPLISGKFVMGLCRLLDSVLTMWRHKLDTVHALEFFIERIAVISPVADQKLGHNFFDKAMLERLIDQRYLMRASTCCAYGDRKTIAVCNGHDLGPLASLSFANASAPFLADANVPSIKHSFTSKPPRSWRSLANA